MILNACVLDRKTVDEKVCINCTRECRHAGEPTTKERLDMASRKKEVIMNNYKAAFENLIEARVPRWYIRLYLLTDLIYFSRVYVYRNVYDIETEDGWYSTNGISLTGGTAADRNRKCYGCLDSLGFPSWDDYKMLFDGDEYDCEAEFRNAYDRHQEDWLNERERERHVSYAN